MMETEVERHYPDIKQSWGIVGMVILLMIVFGIPYAFSKDFLGDQLSFFLYYTFSIGTVFFLAHNNRKKKAGVTQYKFELTSWKIILLVIVAAIGLQLGLVSPLVSLIPMPDFMKEIFAQMSKNTGMFTFLSIVIAAPILEELIFRGIMLDGLLKKYTPVYSIVMSSILFGVVHLNPWQFIGAFIIGSLSGWVYLKTGNLAFSILIHFSNNLVAFLSMLYFSDDKYIDMQLVEFYGSITNMILVTGGGLIAAVLAIYVLNQSFAGSKESFSVNP